MARLQRTAVAGQPHHIIQRGNNREPVFFCDEDYEVYLALVKEYADIFFCHVHAYVLMTNHVHLLITPGTREGLSRLMQFVGRRYVRYINKKYQRTGTLWECRFKSSLIESEQYLLTCMRYIELNAVRAKMTRKPGAYKWSSYSANAEGRKSKLVAPHKLYWDLGSSTEKRCSSYKALFDESISQDDLDLLRHASRGGWAVGSDKFKAKIARVIKSRVAPLPRGGARRRKKLDKTQLALAV